MKKGKDKCEILKEICKYVAEKYGLDYEPTECNHEGDCKGTCPKCEAELAGLQEQLQAKGITDIAHDAKLCDLIEKYAKESQENITESSDEDADLLHMVGMPDIEGMENWVSEPPQVARKKYGYVSMLNFCAYNGFILQHNLT